MKAWFAKLHRQQPRGRVEERGEAEQPPAFNGEEESRDAPAPAPVPAFPVLAVDTALSPPPLSAHPGRTHRGPWESATGGEGVPSDAHPAAPDSSLPMPASPDHHHLAAPPGLHSSASTTRRPSSSDWDGGAGLAGRSSIGATPSLPSMDTVLPGRGHPATATATKAALAASTWAPVVEAAPPPPPAPASGLAPPPRTPPPSPALGWAAHEPPLSASDIPAIGGGGRASLTAAEARRSFDPHRGSGEAERRAAARAPAPPAAASTPAPSPRPSTDALRRASLGSQGSGATARSSFAAEAGGEEGGGSGGPHPMASLLLRPPSRGPAAPGSTADPGTLSVEAVLASTRLDADLWPAAAAFALVPPDTPLPMAMLARLWGLDKGPGGLAAGSAAAEGVIAALAAAGAARVARLGDGSAWALPSGSLHAALTTARAGGTPAEHAALVAAYAGAGGPEAASPPPTPRGPRLAASLAATPDDGYWLPHAGHHLAGAGDGLTLASLLADPDWLDAKLRSYGAAAVTADFRRALSPALAAADPALMHQGQQLVAPVTAPGSSPSTTTAATLAPIDGARLALAAFQMAAPAAAAAPAARGVLRSQMEARLRGVPSHAGVLAPACAAVLAAHAPVDPPPAGAGAAALPPAPPIGLAPRAPTLEQAGGVARLTLRGHTGPVTRALVLPNGVDVATGGADGIRVSDLEVGDCVLRLTHGGLVTDLAAGGGGRLLLSAGSDGRARVWELPGGKCVRELTGHVGPIHGAALDGRGRLALTAGADGALRAWDVERGTCAAALVGHGGAGVRALALSADGRTALTGGEDFCGVVWDIMSGSAATTLAGHSGWVVGVALTPGGEAALTASHDGTARVWLLSHGGCCEHVLAGHTGRLSAVRVSGPDLALTASDDKTARLWDWHTGACLRVFESGAWLADAALVAGPPAPGPGVALTASGDGTVHAWGVGGSDDGASPPPLATMRGHAGPVRCVALTRRGRFAISGGDDATVRVWDVEARALPPPPCHGGAVASVAAVGGGGGGGPGRPASSIFLSVGPDGARAWDAATGAALPSTLPGAATPARWALGSPRGVVLAAAPDTGLRAWRAGPDGHSLSLACVVAGRPGTRVRAFDAAPCAGVALVAAYDSAVWAVHFGPGLEACGGADTPATPEIVHLQTRGGSLAAGGGGRGHSGVTAARLSADGRVALTAAVDGSVRLWDASSGACLAALGAGPHTDAACGLALSPDGRAGVSVSEDGAAAAWDLGRLVDGGPRDATSSPPPPGLPLGKALRVAGAALCPSGRLVLVWGTARTAAASPAAELWHCGPAVGAVPGPGPYRLAVLDPPTGGVAAAAWSACGRAAALASPDGTVRVYRAAGGGGRGAPGPVGSLAGVFMADSSPTCCAFDVPGFCTGGEEAGGLPPPPPTSLAVGCDDGTVHVLGMDGLGWY